jgi:hypothetical protein
MSTMDKLVYVASPYTYHDKKVVEENYRRVSRYAAEVVSQGIVALSPITYGHTLVGFSPMRTDWTFWSNFCLTILSKCDEMHVLMIEGWDLSRGVAEEIEFAEKNNIHVTYVKAEDRWITQSHKEL